MWVNSPEAVAVVLVFGAQADGTEEVKDMHGAPATKLVAAVELRTSELVELV
jgi:hypothetical protein